MPKKDKNLNDILDSAKEAVKKAADEVEQKAKEFAGEAKESAKDFSDQANQAKENLKEEWNRVRTDSLSNKKIIAGILGILFGYLGAHKFVLGYHKEGFILLGLFLISIPAMFVFIGFLTIYIPGLIGFIEGIIYLTKTDDDFYNTYQVGRRPWF
ncbi:MAG: NINE protein [Flavobacteriaceae bacterium]|nr:NINE protein [Flavobacteriaceae bacterium]